MTSQVKICGAAGSFSFRRSTSYEVKTLRRIALRRAKDKKFIPASNGPSSRTCADIWRMPRGSNTPQLAGLLKRFRGMVFYLIGTIHHPEHKKVFFTAGVGIHLIYLFVFKYS